MAETETESATARVWGMPRVREVPDWAGPPLRQFAWMEHGLLWTYVQRGKSPEVHGAQCALAWVGGVHTTAPATAEVADRVIGGRWVS